MSLRVWILDENEDNRLTLEEALVGLGITVDAFSSAEDLLYRSRSPEAIVRPPRAAAVDARTATGYERELTEAMPARLVVVTTCPAAQLAPWIQLGAWRFLLKPYAIESLLAILEDLDRASPLASSGLRKATADREYRRAG